ncbi:uncharacterized protein TM35_000112360 [Trypanosoma theileri]|uniref:Vacuolar sorting protein 39/Transforming growth factor beta receptor-associated zinc finger domain-containing protein n=1 Tax=Trypanosoma theileri TaxID=67003 RepID=A0A1X0NYF2_9TRYP|nr:uncharacterized protein TM35_000112360 [Trypanosoma theileri]ORC89702.1 hypothetical protein TM35_000112360 [Trypanosoma theileri]
MERKTLFDSSHEKTRVNTAVLFPVERTNGEPLLREMHLTSNEELRGLLYVGCANDTLHVYRVLTRLDYDAVRYDVSSSFLHCKQFGASNNESIGNGKSIITSSYGVTFLHVDNEFSTPLLLVVAGGVLDALHYVSLNSVGIFKHLPLPQGTITTCCVAQVQGNGPRQQQQQQHHHRLALIINRWLILVEYTERNSQIIGSGNSNTGESTVIECPHIMISEGTKTLAWQGDIIVTGSPYDYCIINVNTQQIQQRMDIVETFSQGPLCRNVIGYGDTSHILIRIGNNQLALMDLTTETELETAIPIGMSEPILDVAFVSPFIVGVKTDGNVLMQSCLDGEEFPCNSGSLYGFDGVPNHVYSTLLGIYGIGIYSVQLLVLMPKKTIAALYINAGLYERALRYVEYAYESREDELLRRFYNACARHALKEKKYNEAFRYFELAATPTVELLEFLPELRRPLKKGNQWESKVELSLSSGEAYHQLYELLLRRRSLGLGTNSVEQQAIEFAIFLLYVLECVPYTDEELTNLFLTSSTLNPEECLHYVSEGGVRPKPMIYPLVLSCNGQFEEALEQCQKQRLVYEAGVVLRMSGDDELYVRFLPWMLSVNITAALTALVRRPSQQGRQEEKQPSVSLILPMLIGYGGYPLHEYLHHLIYVDHNTDSKLHTLYAINLIDMIQVLQSFGVQGLSANAVRVPAGYESGIRGSSRRSLLTFLMFSQYYDTDTVLAQLLDAGLIEEQVLVLKQAGDHLGALTKLVYELDDINTAVRYCEEQHVRDLQSIGNSTQWFTERKNINIFCDPHGIRNEKRDELSIKKDDKILLTGHNGPFHDGHTFNEYFNILLHVLLVPPAGKQRLLSAALTVLNEHSYCINPLSVMTSLPDEVCVAEISSYLLRAFQTLCNKIQMAEVNANATKSMIADAQRHRDLLQQRCVYVDEKRICAVCGKPLGVGVIAVFPNLKATHFRCFHAPQLDPERGVPFRQDLL